jgi:hypothetical protein
MFDTFYKGTVITTLMSINFQINQKHILGVL